MIYLKSILVGLVASVVAVVVWVLIVVILSLSVNEGGGSLGFIIMSRDIYIAAIFGFMMGCYWRFRHLRRVTRS